jgi:hypothetical protein
VVDQKWLMIVAVDVMTRRKTKQKGEEACT